MRTLAETFDLIVTGIRAAIAVFAGGRVLVPRSRAQFPPTQEDYDRHKLRTEYWVTVYKRVGRLSERFQRLFARWRAGTLPRPQPSRAGRARARKPYLRLPTRLGWLNRTVPDISPCTAQCERMLRHPDLPAFLAAAPQALRLVRPLCHMLGLKPPATSPAATAPSPPSPPVTMPAAPGTMPAVASDPPPPRIFAT